MYFYISSLNYTIQCNYYYTFEVMEVNSISRCLTTAMWYFKKPVIYIYDKVTDSCRFEGNAEVQLKVSENMNVSFQFKFMDPKLKNPAVENLCLGTGGR